QIPVRQVQDLLKCSLINIRSIAGFVVCSNVVTVQSMSQFSQLTVACLAEHLLKKSCMMNPPERRGIMTDVWLRIV
ncbi:TPA: hypothetical protein ACV7R4_005217, partial [Escherichia coli]